MILNRRSAKKTSKVSLVIAVTMISTIFAVLHTQGYQVEYLTQNGVEVCKMGVLDLFVSFLW